MKEQDCQEIAEIVTEHVRRWQNGEAPEAAADRLLRLTIDIEMYISGKVAQRQ